MKYIFELCRKISRCDWSSQLYTQLKQVVKLFFTIYGYITNSQCDQLSPSWLDRSVGRAPHRYRRGHGFESRSGLNFFQASVSQLLKLCVYLRWSIMSSYLSPQFKYMIFHVFTWIRIFRLRDSLLRTVFFFTLSDLKVCGIARRPVNALYLFSCILTCLTGHQDKTQLVKINSDTTHLNI